MIRTLPVPPLRWTYAALVSLLVLSGLDQTILSTALPIIAHDLGGHGQTSWLFSAYLIASTVVIPMYGKLADRLGVRPLLVTAASLFVAGSVACGLSSSLDMLIVARAVQGTGGGGLMTLTMLAMAVLYAPEQRGHRQAMLGAAYGVSTMLGPLIGGVVVQYLSWRWAFLLNVPLALAATAVLATSAFPAAPLHRHPLDGAGAALLAIALVCLLLATRRDGGTAAWWLAAVGAALLLAWWQVERRAADPILPLSMFSAAAFSAATFISASSGVALFTAVVFLPTYLQAALHLTPTDSAVHLLPLMLGITLAAQVSGRALRAAVSARSLAYGAMASMALAFAALTWICKAAPGQTLALSAAVLPLGAGLGLLFPLVTVVSQRAVPPRHMGIATATPIMLRALGGAIGVALLGELLRQRIADGLGVSPAAIPTGRGAAAAAGIDHTAFANAFASALGSVFTCALGVCLVAAVAARWLPRQLPRLVAAPAGASVSP